MALEADKGADSVIRQVQKALGKGSQAAAFAPLLYGRKGLDGLEQLPADWLADNAREAMAFIATKPKRRHKVRVRDRKSTRLNSSHIQKSRMPSSA